MWERAILRVEQEGMITETPTGREVVFPFLGSLPWIGRIRSCSTLKGEYWKKALYIVRNMNGWCFHSWGGRNGQQAVLRPLIHRWGLSLRIQRTRRRRVPLPKCSSYSIVSYPRVDHYKLFWLSSFSPFKWNGAFIAFFQAALGLNVE